MSSSREGVCGNNAVQFQSYDDGSYCTALGEKWLHWYCLLPTARFVQLTRFLHAQKQSQAEIHHKLCIVYGSDIMNDSMVRRWRGQFTEGRTNVHDQDRSGRSFLVTPELMESVQQAVSQNQYYTSLLSMVPDVSDRLIWGYDTGIQTLVHWYDKCLNGRDHVEK